MELLSPLSILDKNERTGKFELNEENLQRIFINEIEPDCEVSIISIAGGFRKGKSFMLNFFLRYLKSTIVLQENGNWLNLNQELNDGFEWKNGCHAHTSGILIWPEIFYQTNDEDKRVAIILIDTQGVFATNSTNIENIAIFAFSTMLTSVQIFNVSQTIQEDNLQNLQLFTEYGRISSEHSTVEPFQNLYFLVRDWQDDENFPNGSVGGEKYLNECLEVNSIQSTEIQRVRNHINNSFEEINCFLLPHPGMVIQRGRFTGNLTEIEDDFIEGVKQFVPMILARNNLIIKKINGRIVLGRDLFGYINNYWTLFMDDNIPTPHSMLEATVHATCNAAKNRAYDTYIQKMNHFTLGTEPLESSELMTFHTSSKNEALQMFNTETTIGENALKEPYRVLLRDSFERNIIIYMGINDGKRHRMETTQLTRQLSILGAIMMIVGLGTTILTLIPSSIPAATSVLETALAPYLSGVTAGELSVGIGGLLTTFGPALISMITNFMEPFLV